MIRCSVNNDREGIISLWHESFGDNRKEIEFFLDNKYIPENTVVCVENGKIISQLFAYTGEMNGHILFRYPYLLCYVCVRFRKPVAAHKNYSIFCR